MFVQARKKTGVESGPSAAQNHHEKANGMRMLVTSPDFVNRANIITPCCQRGLLQLSYWSLQVLFSHT